MAAVNCSCPTNCCSFFCTQTIANFLNEKKDNRQEIANWLFNELKTSLEEMTDYYKHYRNNKKQPTSLALTYVQYSLKLLLVSLKDYLPKEHKAHRLEFDQSAKYDYSRFSYKEQNDVNLLFVKISLAAFRKNNIRKKTSGKHDITTIGKKFYQKIIYQPSQKNIQNYFTRKPTLIFKPAGAFC